MATNVSVLRHGDNPARVYAKLRTHQQTAPHGRLVHYSTTQSQSSTSLLTLPYLYPYYLRRLGLLHGVYVPLSSQMTTGLMRRFSSSARTQLSSSASRSLTSPRLLGLRQYQRTITDIRARQASVARHWFTSSSPPPGIPILCHPTTTPFPQSKIEISTPFFYSEPAAPWQTRSANGHQAAAVCRNHPRTPEVQLTFGFAIPF